MIPPRLRPLARRLRRLPDRLLHPSRSQAALEAISRLASPQRVLFVCHGNICRSPYAAAVARRLLPPGVVVESAGFIGADRPSPPEALAVAAERGIDLGPHRSRLIDFEAVRDVGLVVVMDTRQRRRLLSARAELRGRVVLLGDLDPEPIVARAIPDPVEQPAEAFRACYDRIDRCVGALAALWRAPGGDDAQGQRGELK